MCFEIFRVLAQYIYAAFSYCIDAVRRLFVGNTVANMSQNNNNTNASTNSAVKSKKEPVKSEAPPNSSGPSPASGAPVTGTSGAATPSVSSCTPISETRKAASPTVKTAADSKVKSLPTPKSNKSKTPKSVQKYVNPAKIAPAAAGKTPTSALKGFPKLDATPKSCRAVLSPKTALNPKMDIKHNPGSPGSAPKLGDMAITDNPDGGDGNNTKDFYQLYDVQEILGKGMSSVVRRCIEKCTNTEFAVKILDVSTEKMTQEEADDLRNCTKREIQMLRAVAGHENIISLHDVYETSTFLFVIFELARGGELFDYLTEVVTLSEKKTRHIMRQLIESVKVMHEKRIVHRDLKPENILMVGDDKIKLTDFGFAYQLEEGETLRELCGTPGYLAPEVLAVNMDMNSVGGYGIQVDMWACGVIMYTLLCGYAPFFHRRQLLMLRAISAGKFEFRSPEWDEVGASAKDLITKLLVVDPRKRLTVHQALQHPFLALHAFVEKELKFNARKRFRMAIIQVRMMVRLLRILKVPMLIPVGYAKENPYATRKVRRQVDAVAFRIYGHWVKKGREQYRDALFANAPMANADTPAPLKAMSSAI